jgi:hypothetical protein
MIKWSTLLLLFVITNTNAQIGCNCQSQLMRLEVEGGALTNALTSSPKLQEALVPSLTALFASDVFKSKVVTDYPMLPMGFPANIITCNKEKADGDPKFKNIDCYDPLLCASSDISQEVKSEVCVALPCSLIMGSQGMGKCGSKTLARPTMVHFPRPVGVKKLEMKPLSVSTDDGVLKACFDISALEITAGVDVEFGKEPNLDLEYERMGLDNINVKIDGNREVCMSAKLDLSKPEPLSEISIEHKNGNFISDKMIAESMAGANVRGMSGYTPATLSILKLTAVPPLARYFRPTLEDAIQKSLAKSFQLQVSTLIADLDKKEPTQINTPTNSFLSEMGVGNIVVKKYIDLMDCSLLKQENKPIPAGHKCLNQLYPFKKKNLSQKDIPRPADAANMIAEQMARYDQVTSEDIRSRVASFENRMTGLNLGSVFNSKLKPIDKKISDKQLESSMFNNIQIMTKIGNGTSAGVGVAIPELCDIDNPSPHFGKSIPNCPIQTYIDLNELNSLLTSMFKSGRLCHSGKGDFVPETNAKGEQVRNDDGSPRGNGCLFSIEEDEDGMRCFLNGAPQLKYDSVSGGYKVDLKTKECFRGAVALGQGKIGGDINFEIGFTPSICDQGDFCLENGNANWNVVPGTARYALKDSSWFNGIVKGTIDKKLKEIISQTIKVPLSSGSGPMSMIPLEAEGRIDKGPGYFGACLKTK